MRAVPRPLHLKRDAPRCARQGVHARCRRALRLPHGGAGWHTWRASLLVVCLAVFSHGAAAFTCTTPGTVCNALGDFYSATNGAAWRSTYGWVTAAGDDAFDYCQFQGVTCTNGVVTELYVHPRVGTGACCQTRAEAHACFQREARPACIRSLLSFNQLRTAPSRRALAA